VGPCSRGPQGEARHQRRHLDPDAQLRRRVRRAMADSRSVEGADGAWIRLHRQVPGVGNDPADSRNDRPLADTDPRPCRRGDYLYLGRADAAGVRDPRRGGEPPCRSVRRDQPGEGRSCRDARLGRVGRARRSGRGGGCSADAPRSSEAVAWLRLHCDHRGVAGASQPARGDRHARFGRTRSSPASR